jgi:hypothetical protein
VPLGHRVARDVDVDDLAVLINGSIRVTPLAGNLRVGLVHEPTVAGNEPTRPGRVGEEWGEALHPPMHRDVIDRDSTRGPELFDIAVGRPTRRYQRRASTMISHRNRNPAKADLETAGTGRERRGLSSTPLTALPEDSPIQRPTEQLGGYRRTLNKHRELGTTDEQRFRYASLMSLAADEARMPNDPKFRSGGVAYLKWGTRLALGNSLADVVVEHGPYRDGVGGSHPWVKVSIAVMCTNALPGRTPNGSVMVLSIAP